MSVAGIFFFCYKAHLLLLFLLLSFFLQWEDRMDKGLFRYDVTACETMVTFLNTHLFTLQPRIVVTCFIPTCLNSTYLSRQWISFHTHLEYLLQYRVELFRTHLEHLLNSLEGDWVKLLVFGSRFFTCLNLHEPSASNCQPQSLIFLAVFFCKTGLRLSMMLMFLLT